MSAGRLAKYSFWSGENSFGCIFVMGQIDNRFIALSPDGKLNFYPCDLVWWVRKCK